MIDNHPCRTTTPIRPGAVVSGTTTKAPVAGMGFEPHDLYLMRVASYLTALPRVAVLLVESSGFEPESLKEL